MQPQAQQELEEKLKWMKTEFKGFPLMNCRNSSIELHEDKGYLVVMGIYCGPFSHKYRKQAHKKWKDLPKRFSQVPHDFSYNPDTKLFIDLTAKQFHDSNPDILIIPADDPRVALCHDDICSATTHYVKQMYIFKKENGWRIPHIAPRELKPKRFL